MKKILVSLTAIAFVFAGLAGCGSDAPASNDNSDFVTQMAIKTQGDPSKLTPEERKRMDELTKNDTETVLRFHPASTMQPVNPPKGK